MTENIVLQSFEKINEFYEWGSKTIFYSTDRPYTNGWYKIIDKNISALVVKNKKIYYTFNDMEIELSDKIHATLEKLNGNFIVFQIYNQDVLENRFSYESDQYLSGISPFEYIDEEDSNWGLFLFNIINNRERQILILSNKENSD